MASYDIHGCDVTREPVPVKHPETGEETTGWEFTVRKDGHPIPVVVTSLDRTKGLNETRKAIRKYVAQFEAEPALPVQM